MSEDLQKQVDEVILALGKEPFSTYSFIKEFRKRFPSSWKKIESKYGPGGEGSGKFYTSFVYAGQLLKNKAQRGEIVKLGYEHDVPKGWGSPVIRYWVTTGSEVVVTTAGKDRIVSGAFPEEITVSEDIFEGAKKTIVVNIYERDPAGRERCIEHWGSKCSVCGFDFQAAYGDIGSGFIHVHHLISLSSVGRRYRLDPVKHLRPVCPNCHAMLHHVRPPFKITELKKIIKDNKGLSKA